MKKSQKTLKEKFHDFKHRKYNLCQEEQDKYYRRYFWLREFTNKFLYAVFLIFMTGIVLLFIAIFIATSTPKSKCGSFCSTVINDSELGFILSFIVFFASALISMPFLMAMDYYWLPDYMNIAIAINKLIEMKLSGKIYIGLISNSNQIEKATNKKLGEFRAEAWEIRKHKKALKNAFRIMINNDALYSVVIRNIFKEFYNTFNTFFIYF